MKIIFAIILMIAGSAASAKSQAPADSAALRLVEEGKTWLAQNKLKQAEQALREALKKDAKLTTAMDGLAEVAMAKQDWGEASNWYEKIIKREPQNLDAMYHRAICYRESGKFQGLLFRKRDWDKSALYFERVLAQDSLYRDTIYQYAELQRYRGKYTEAILWGHRQIRLKPELVEAQRGLFRLYQYFLDNRNEKEVLAWLQTHDSEHARYFVGETYRRSGKFDSAEAVLRRWMASAPMISLAPAYLSLARLDDRLVYKPPRCETGNTSLTQLEYKREQTISAEKYFWQAVDGIRDQVDAELVFEDIKYIVTEAELQEFRRLSHPTEHTAFFHNLWTNRDSKRGANLDLLLMEHYRRLLYAEKNYIYDSFRTWFNNPDKLGYLEFPPTYYLNDRLNDKGLVYIRHGEPADRVATVAAAKQNESWFYEPTGLNSEMTFHFTIDETAGGNNWRLTPFFVEPQMLADRLPWKPSYYRLLRPDLYPERLALQEKMAQESAAAIALGFRTVTASIMQSYFPADTTAQRLVAEGRAWLAQKEFKKAEKAFRMALQINSTLTTAMAGLGEAAIAKQDWGEANDWYEKILECEPKNLDAMYYRGICFRETGKFKALLMRDLDWNNSQKYFKRVLAQDSLYRDTLLQYAFLQRYREEYEEAITFGYLQTRLKPELAEAQRGLFRLYQYLLDNRGEKEALKWLQAHGSEHARYFIGELQRRAGKLDSAEAILQSWLAAAPTISKAPAYLSLARLHYQREQPQAAEKFFWQAVDGIRDQADALLVFDGVKYIVTEAELQEYQGLASPDEYIAYFHRLWVSRDPTPAASFNARLAEHYRRLLYVEKGYIFDRFRTWFNNPDKLSYLKFPPAYYLNDRFNDKGLIYIRHGEPDERVMTVAAQLNNESWRYAPTETTPELMFHFVVDEFAGASNWRLTAVLPNADMWADRVGWDTAYFRLLQGDPLEHLKLVDDLAVKSVEAVDVGFRTDRHSWDKEVKPLEFASYTACFKAPEGKTSLEVYYSLPLPASKELEKMPDTTVVYEHGLALHDLQWKPVQRWNDEITKAKLAGLDPEQNLLGQNRLSAEPDSYHVAFFIRQPTTQRLEGWKQDIYFPDFSKNELAMSSIVLASDIAPASGSGSFVKNGLHITPNPSRRFKRKEPVHVYFEVYNLTPDTGGNSSFSIEYTALLQKEKKSGAQKLFSLFGSGAKPATTLAVERQAEATTSVEYLALDLGKAGEGEFRLNIKIKDKHSAKQAEGFIDFTLF